MNLNQNPAEQHRKAMWTNMAFCLLLIVGFTLYRSFNGGPAAMVELSPDGMKLNSSAGVTTQVMWDQVAQAEIRSDVDYGTCVSGTDTGKEKSGVWQNDEFGEYDLYIDPKIDSCVACLLEDGRYVLVNVENAKTTKSLYEQILLVSAE